MNLLQSAEYITLRLIRRFLFNERLANRCARFLPYYSPSENERHPERIVSIYVDALAKVGNGLPGNCVLEVGAGRTNAVGYGLVARGARCVVVLEPFIAFDPPCDEAMRNASPELAAVNRASVTRAISFDDISSASCELLLSNSVLEHVSDLRAFFSGCLRVLSEKGAMVHVVDYRDHFFKYPYAFLRYGERTWKRWLNPGDLPRWRVYDHIDAMRAAGFEVTILHQESDPGAFAKIRSGLDSTFLPMRDGLDVTRAILLARKSASVPAFTSAP